MYDLFILIGGCTLIACFIEKRTEQYSYAYLGIKKDIQSKVLYIGMLIWFIVFAGLRTRYGDTPTYIENFNAFVSDTPKFSMIFEPYGGFELYQSLIKKFFNANPQWFVMISAIICCALTVPYITRHTNCYTGAIYLYCTSAFTFSMTAIKQAMSVAIALWAIEAFLNKKYFRAIFLLLMAMSFHPYVICLISVMFLKGRVWSIKTVIVALAFAFAFVNLESLFALIATIGQDYSSGDFDAYTINPIRVLLEAIPIVISFIYRDKIRRENDIYLNLGINMRIISFTFIFLGLFFAPIYLGRMASYFEALSAIAIAKMVKVSFRDEQNGKLFILAYYLIFAVYFLFDLYKLGRIELTYDRFQHTDFSSLF